MAWLEACPSPVTLQTHHGTASSGQLQGVGCAPSPTPPATPDLCTCLSWGRGKPGTLVAMGMGVGWGIWESKVQNRSQKVGGRSVHAKPGTCKLFQKSSLQKQSQRLCYSQFQDDESRALHQTKDPSEFRAPCDRTGHTLMKPGPAARACGCHRPALVSL